MKRRSFVAGIWLLLGLFFGVRAAMTLDAGELVGYGFAGVTLAHLGGSGYYWLHPASMERPDEPAPRRWFELVGFVIATLVVSMLILHVTIG